MSNARSGSMVFINGITDCRYRPCRKKPYSRGLIPEGWRSIISGYPVFKRQWPARTKTNLPHFAGKLSLSALCSSSLWGTDHIQSLFLNEVCILLRLWHNGGWISDGKAMDSGPGLEASPILETTCGSCVMMSWQNAKMAVKNPYRRPISQLVWIWTFNTSQSRVMTKEDALDVSAQGRSTLHVPCGLLGQKPTITILRPHAMFRPSRTNPSAIRSHDCKLLVLCSAAELWMLCSVTLGLEALRLSNTRLKPHCSQCWHGKSFKKIANHGRWHARRLSVCVCGAY